MHTKRIIPCLDIKNGRVVKGVNFLGLQDAGDPVEIAKRYNEEGADEIVFLDITATNENRGTIVDVLENVAKEVFVPLCVGGGVKTLSDFYRLLKTGCDKVSINSAAIANPKLIEESAHNFGSQCVVVAMDVKFTSSENKYYLYINGGKTKTNKEVLSWAKEVSERGAGEILLTSMDADGTKCGYDNKLLKLLNEHIDIPLIASGGAGNMQHFKEALSNGADAVLAASVFHYREIALADLKNYLHNNSIPIRH